MCRETCGIFSVCGGGKPVDQLFETSSFVVYQTPSVASTNACRQPILVLDCLDQMPAAVEPEAMLHRSCRDRVRVGGSQFQGRPM